MITIHLTASIHHHRNVGHDHWNTQFVQNEQNPHWSIIIFRYFRRIMASPRRFERPACRLGGGCSIQLSYGDRVGDYSCLRVRCLNIWWARLTKYNEEFKGVVVQFSVTFNTCFGYFYLVIFI
jgi:hypothetical protein